MNGGVYLHRNNDLNINFISIACCLWSLKCVVNNYSQYGRALPCNCDGCELDSKPLVSGKNPYWFKFRQIVPIDLITKFVGTIFMTTDVATGKFCYSVRKISDLICNLNLFVCCFLSPLQKKNKKKEIQVTTLRHKSYPLFV